MAMSVASYRVYVAIGNIITLVLTQRHKLVRPAQCLAHSVRYKMHSKMSYENK